MNKQEGSETKSKNNRNRLIILAVAGALLLCCAIILAVAYSQIFSKSKSLFTKDITPSHYGVFIKQGGDLIELEERESFNIPTAGDFGNLEVVTDAQPTIVVWRNNTNLDYLKFYILGEYLGESSEIKYNATPKNDGIIEISPSSPLQNGEYCLVQGDPVGVSVPWWCFKTGSTDSDTQINPSTIVSSDVIRSWKEGVPISDGKITQGIIKWDSNSEQLTTCQEDGANSYFIVYDILKQKRTGNIDFPEWASCLSISENEKDILYLDNKENVYKTYNIKSKKISLLSIIYNDSFPYGLDPAKFSPNENIFAYLQKGQNAQTIKIWDLNSDKELYSWNIGDVGVHEITFSRDGRFLGVVGNDYKTYCRFLKIFDVNAGSEFQSFGDKSCIESMNIDKTFVQKDSLYPTSIDFSYDSKLIAVGYLSAHLTKPGISQVTIWDVQTGNLVTQLKGNSSIPLVKRFYDLSDWTRADYYGGILKIAFSPDNRILSAIATEKDKEIKIYFWDVSSGEVVNEVNSLVNPYNLWYDSSEIGFSPNGKYFFAVDRIYGIK